MRGQASLFTAILMSTALAGPALAEPTIWGQAELGYGIGNISGREGNAESIDDTSPNSYEALGRIGVEFGAFGTQLDLSYVGQDIDPDEYTGYTWGKYAALRANYDITPALTVGALYGAGDGDSADDGPAEFDFYALEGAYAFGSGMYGLQLGAFDGRDEDFADAFHDGTFVRAKAIYTLGNGGVIEGAVAYFDGDQDSSALYEMHAITLGVEYSQQFRDRPIAWSVGLDGAHYTNGDAGDNGAYQEARLTLGLTTWFGDSDLSSAKRRGFFDQPDFGRITQSGNNLD